MRSIRYFCENQPQVRNIFIIHFHGCLRTMYWQFHGTVAYYRSCYGKTKNVNQSQNHHLQLRASTSIQPGEEICNQYTKPLLATLGM